MGATDARVAAGGVIYVGGDSAVAPTSAVSTLVGFTDVGLISSDGFQSSEGIEKTDLKQWNGSTVRTVQTGKADTVKFAMIETTDTVWDIWFGNSDGQQTATLKPTGPWIFDSFDGDVIVRGYAPLAQVTDKEDQDHKNDDFVKYGVTLTCSLDDNGVSIYWFKTA